MTEEKTGGQVLREALRARKTRMALLAQEISLTVTVLEAFAAGKIFLPVEKLDLIARQFFGEGVFYDETSGLLRSAPQPEATLIGIPPERYPGRALAPNERWPREPTGRPLPTPAKAPRPGWAAE
jgi:hypothetical protein